MKLTPEVFSDVQDKIIKELYGHNLLNEIIRGVIAKHTPGTLTEQDQETLRDSLEEDLTFVFE